MTGVTNLEPLEARSRASQQIRTNLGIVLEVTAPEHNICAKGD